jgi:hypothetical protein
METTKTNQEQIAAQLALAFDVNRERVSVERRLDENGAPTERFPRFTEVVEKKTTEELAESEAIHATVNALGMAQERPLTFLEIVEMLSNLGYRIENN